MNHIQVELLNHTAWWQLWLPVLTAFIVAAVAFAGVVKSNRTNRMAISAADQRSKDEMRESRDRDFRQWRRDNLRQIGTETVRIAIRTLDHLNTATTEEDDPTDDLFQKKWLKALEPVRSWGADIEANSPALRMIDADDAAKACRELAQVVTRAGVSGEPHAYSAMLNAKRIAAKTLNRRISEQADQNEIEGVRALIQAHEAQLEQAKKAYFDLIETIVSAQINFERAILSELDSNNVGSQTATQPSELGSEPS
ncbi:hypothetical protein [Mycobacterium sp. SA01]|uniref:hypothetical protein n=1 Tax=Mycobacterium sp. SA01 TaxID=3238820 RepID=UPI00351AC4C3